MSALAFARYPQTRAPRDFTPAFPVPSTEMKKSLVAIMPMYSRVAGGVSRACCENPTPPSTKPAARIAVDEDARTFESSMNPISVREVVETHP